MNDNSTEEKTENLNEQIWVDYRGFHNKRPKEAIAIIGISLILVFGVFFMLDAYVFEDEEEEKQEEEHKRPDDNDEENDEDEEEKKDDEKEEEKEERNDDEDSPLAMAENDKFQAAVASALEEVFAAGGGSTEVNNAMLQKLYEDFGDVYDLAAIKDYFTNAIVEERKRLLDKIDNVENMIVIEETLYGEYISKIEENASAEVIDEISAQLEKYIDELNQYQIKLNEEINTYKKIEYLKAIKENYQKRNSLLVSYFEEDWDVGFYLFDFQANYVVDKYGEGFFATTEFGSETLEIFVTGKLYNVSEELSLKVAWYYANDRIKEENITVTAGTENLWHRMSKPSAGWQTGNYEVVVYDDDEEIANTTFTIVEDGVLSQKSFFDFELSFYLEYKNEWHFNFIDSWQVAFRGPEGTNEYFTVVDVQTILTAAIGGQYENLDDHYEDYKAKIADLDGYVTDYSEGTLTSLGVDYTYYVFNAEYEQEGGTAKQKVYLIARNDDRIHQVSYTAPAVVYDDYYHIFDDIMTTFTVVR